MTLAAVNRTLPTLSRPSNQFCETRQRIAKAARRADPSATTAGGCLLRAGCTLYDVTADHGGRPGGYNCSMGVCLVGGVGGGKYTCITPASLISGG